VLYVTTDEVEIGLTVGVLLDITDVVGGNILS
jgi:hypothetical protein